VKRIMYSGILAWSAMASFAADVPAKQEAQSPAPAPVNPAVMTFLSRKVSMEFESTPPAEALQMQFHLMGARIKVASTPKAWEKKLTLRLENATGAEALRTVGEKTGLGYRIVADTIRLATPEEWKQIDAGTVKFEDLVKETKK